jgi:signal recognition particle subunit SRP72
VLLKAGSEPYLAQRLAGEIPTPASGDHLFEYQASVLKRNKYIIGLQAQKFAGVEKSTASIISGSKGTPISSEKASLGVVHAAAAAHLKTGKEALRQILPLLEKRPDDVGLLLTIIQLYVQSQNPVAALHLLEAFFKRLESATAPEFADVRHAPGLVALAVALYRLQGRPGAARAALSAAAAHWGKQSEGTAESESLLREAGIELLRSSNSSELAVAGAAFERLAEEGSHGDRAATAGLVASFATSDPAKVQPHLASLTPVDRLVAGIDVSALLDAGVAALPTIAAAGKKRAAADDVAARASAAKKPRRRLRASRMPKDYDPDKKPDPERWLPLRDRSTYRPPKGKKGKGGKRAADATQGGFVAPQETLELVGGAGAVKVEKAAGGTATGASSGGGGGGGSSSKKKKKGKK